MMARRLRARARASVSGATTLEFAFVLTPLLVVIVGIIVFGTVLFYQQQINNSAREAARYASTHSANAQCPTVSWLPPAAPADYPTYYRCDKPETGWRGIPPPLGQAVSAAPGLTNAARLALFGLDRSRVQVAACWSGFWRTVSGSDPPAKASSVAYDAPPPSVDAPDSAFFSCRLNGKDPRTATDDLACPEPAVDQAGAVLTSDEGSDVPGNSVTVYVCYLWTPPLGGLLGLPSTVTFRAVATEVLNRQR